jgi:lipopolysaccharide export system protein LptA
MKSLFASPQAKIVSSSAGQPDAVSTSRDLTATFDPAHRGALIGIAQRGDFHFTDSQRTAAAELADYTPADDTITLSGSPRIQDIAGGLNITADHIKMNRVSQGIAADGNVKTTYQTGKGKNAAGALLSSPSGDPAHVTGDAMTFAKTSGLARFTGHARLWQGGDIIQAPVITLDRKNNSLLASEAEGASVGQPAVTVSFAKTDKAGKIQPITVVGARLTYTDADRVAKWDGPVQMKMADATMSAKRLDIFLQSKSSSGTTGNAPSQIDHAVAHGDVVIEQRTPPRKATGETLIYTAAEDKFVLTGSSGKPPSIFDAEHGNVTGNSLTFYNRDDRVQIGGSESSRTVTRTAIKSESKP